MSGESEEAIVARVVTWLRADGWSTWQEVQVRGGRADIVGRRAGLVWCFEAKRSASLQLLEQGLERQRVGAFHGVVLVVPGPRVQAFSFVCSRLGLGLLCAGRPSSIGAPEPLLVRWPAFDRAADTREVLRGCTDDHAAQAGGTPGARKVWTPFKACVRAVVEHFEREGLRQLPVREVAALAPVLQYKARPASWPKLDDRAQAQALRRWVVQAIEHRWLPGFELAGAGRDRVVTFDPAKVSAEDRKAFRMMCR